MKKTVYIIRHAEQLKIEGKVIDNVSPQILNEKITLTVSGEEAARDLSKCRELKNVQEVWTSNYVRAIDTAKYIAYENGIELNVDEAFGERKLGDLNELKELGKDKKHSYTTEQLLNPNLKVKDGESLLDIQNRMYQALENLLLNSNSKNIVIVSHGAAIKFLLMKWCRLDENANIIFDDKIIAKEKIMSPQTFKLEFDDLNLVNISNIDI